MILFVNACIRANNSRTLRLTNVLLKQLNEPFTELNLSDIAFQPVDYSYIQTRDLLLSEGDYNHLMFELARQFAAADTIVIAAPFWDLSFPTILKQYLEQINVSGITFRYTEEGYPVGLCNAKKLYYVTTAGGMFFPEEYGFGYIRALAENFYGIKECIMFKALGLDIDGADEEQILLECEKKICESI